MRTVVYTNAQVFLHHAPTPTAHLRRVGGVYARDCTASIRSFAVQQRVEHPQACIVRRQREGAIAEHQIEVQIFQRNCAVAVHQRRRDLVPEVFTGVGDVFVQKRNLTTCFASAVTALLATRRAALRSSKFRERTAQPARVVNSCPIGKRKQAQQSDISGDGRLTIRHKFRRWYFQLQIDVPTACFALEDDMLDRCTSGQRAMKLDLQVPNPLHVQQHALVVLRQLHTIAVGVFDTVEAVVRLEAWVSRCLACLETAKEGGIGFVEPTQQVLKAAGIQVAFLFGKAVTPVAEVTSQAQCLDVFASRFVGVLAHFQREVVDQLALIQQRVQAALFGAARIEAVLVGQQTCARIAHALVLARLESLWALTRRDRCFSYPYFSTIERKTKGETDNSPPA
jgi:hypothetical protein